MFSGTIKIAGIGSVTVTDAPTLSEVVQKLQDAIDAKEATVAPIVTAVAVANNAMQS